MNKYIAILFGIFILSFLTFCQLRAQLSFSNYQASNRFEYQLTYPDKSESLLNWLDVDYYLDQFITGLRFKIDQPTHFYESNVELKQRYFEFKENTLKLRVGNFYKRMGRGLLFHAFEIQKITLNHFEQNFVVDRNMDGLLVDWQYSKFEFSAFTGKPSWPSFSENVRGAEFYLNALESTYIGFGYLRDNQLDSDTERKNEYLSFSTDFNLKRLSFFGEYAFRREQGKKSYESDQYGLYLSSNVYFKNIGISLEFKDYKQFANGFNNPPTLIKEHSFSLLNRHTHQVNLNDEVGYQLEITSSPFKSTSFVFNYTNAHNHGGEKFSRFYEYYGEVRSEVQQDIVICSALDRSSDLLVGDDWRNTWICEIDYYYSQKLSFTTDIQFQQINNLYLEDKIKNSLFMFGINVLPSFSLNLQWEWSNDPREDKHHWIITNINLKINQNHDFFVSIGKRKAGLNCTSGQCKYIPEFKGIEVRLNSRF